MPRGVYDRTKKKDKAPGGGRLKGRASNGYPDLLAKMRAEKLKAEDRVVALGTAIEILEGLE